MYDMHTLGVLGISEKDWLEPGGDGITFTIFVTTPKCVKNPFRSRLCPDSAEGALNATVAHPLFFS